MVNSSSLEMAKWKLGSRNDPRRARPVNHARSRPRVEALEERYMRTRGSATVPVDAILEWNDVMLQANANDHALESPEQGGPILTARAFAIVSAAMYDAYNSVEHIGEPYQVMVPRASRADADAAVAQAAHDTLVALFPSQQALFDEALTETLAGIRDGRAESRGRAVGADVAEQILAARADDGAADIGTPEHVPNGLAGFHAADPLHPDQGYYAPGPENVTPFVVTSLDQFASRQLDDGTPDGRAAFLASAEYAAAYNEVLALGGDGVSTPTERTAEQTEIGIFWGYDGRPGLGTPPRLYNQIVRTVAMQEGNTEAENARLFALVNIAMADAGLTSWDDKYELDFWRPILGIRAGDSDGNAATIDEEDWSPLGAAASNPQSGETNFTPPFPAYTSGHATFGAAALQTLARFYGRDVSFSFTSDEFNGVTVGSDGEVRPVVTRTFDSFTDAKLENAQSRIYLGIHWRFDADEGIATGDAVADYVFDTILEPGHGHEHDGGGHGGGGGHRGGHARSAAERQAAAAANCGSTHDTFDTMLVPGFTHEHSGSGDHLEGTTQNSPEFLISTVNIRGVTFGLTGRDLTSLQSDPPPVERHRPNHDHGTLVSDGVLAMDEVLQQYVHRGRKLGR